MGQWGGVESSSSHTHTRHTHTRRLDQNRETRREDELERHRHRKRDSAGVVGEGWVTRGSCVTGALWKASNRERERKREKGWGGVCQGGQTSMLSHPSAAHTSPATLSVTARQHATPQDRNLTLLSPTHITPTAFDTSPASTAPSTGPASSERESKRARARKWARRARYYSIHEHESHERVKSTNSSAETSENQTTHTAVRTHKGTTNASHQCASHERESINELEHRSQRAPHATHWSIHELLRPSLTLALSESYSAPTPEPGPRSWACSPSPSRVFFSPHFPTLPTPLRFLPLADLVESSLSVESVQSH